MRRIVLNLVLPPALVQCGNDTGGPSQPTEPDIAGAWNWSQSIGDDVQGVSCSDQGAIEITQTGSRFSGAINSTGACTLPNGSIPRSGSASTSAGQVWSQEISFRIEPLCQCAGTLSGTPPNVMSGTVSCDAAFFPDFGDTISLSGTWQTTR